MNKELLQELYESAYRYPAGRMRELLLLAAAEIQRLELMINK